MTPGHGITCWGRHFSQSLIFFNLDYSWAHSPIPFPNYVHQVYTDIQGNLNWPSQNYNCRKTKEASSPGQLSLGPFLSLPRHQIFHPMSLRCQGELHYQGDVVRHNGCGDVMPHPWGSPCAAEEALTPCSRLSEARPTVGNSWMLAHSPIFSAF